MRLPRSVFLGISTLWLIAACGNQGNGEGSGGHGGGSTAVGGSTTRASGGSNTGGSATATSSTGGAAGGAGSSPQAGGAAGGTTAKGGGGTGSSGSGGSGTRPGAGGSPGSGGTTSRATGGTTTAGAGGATSNGSSTGGSTGRGGAPGTGGTTKADAGAPPGTGGTPTDGGTSQWPQCFASDKMPADDAVLKQRAPTSDYETQVTYGGVAMLIGANRQSCLTDTLVNFDVKDLNGEIKDIVETLQFPGFLDWTRGYYMNWVILNSGIPGATLSGQGGHQGDRWGHMNFESTEECPCNWGTGDSSNRGNALHESIHALQAELWAFNNQASGWIHEAHNCYLGTQRVFSTSGKYTMGYGAAAALQMPHGPIESMGMNTDDSWAGPADQNAKTYVNSIVRYGLEIFFASLNLEMGRGFINCMWIDGSKAGNPDQRRSGNLSVFQALQSYAGEAGAANAIMTFGARSALLDFGGWTEAVRSTMKGNWNTGYWFYTFPSGDGTAEWSPPTKQIPHHQGRNIIPIKVASGATAVTVSFTPDSAGSKGTKQRMEAQLVYRDSADQPVYGTRFSSGENTIDVSGGVRNGIVNLVVAVTNPNATSGSDDGSNKGFDAQEHFNYKARIVSGGTIAPTTTRPW